MKFSLLALPALALAAVSPAQQALQEKDLAIITDASQQIAPLESSLQSALKAANPTDAQIKQIKSDQTQINSILATTKQQLTAAEQASGLSKRQSESPAQQLEDALNALVTEVGMGLAALIIAGSPVTDAVGDLLDQGLGALAALGDPLSAAIPEAGDEISAGLTSILGGTPSS